MASTKGQKGSVKMENAINVEYEEVKDLESESNEELAHEANLIWQQMETIGAIGVQMAAEAGKRLKLIKDRIGYGGWSDWAKGELDFSLRKAENMIKLSEKIGNENNIYTETQTFAFLGISKVWELLAAPEDTAEEILEDPKSTDMTVKEFKDEIKRITEENKQLRADNEEAADLMSQIDELKKQAADASNEDEEVKREFESEIAKLKSELNDMKESEREKVKKAKAKAEADAEKKAEADIEAARKAGAEEGRKENETAIELARQRADKAEEEAERLKKTSDPLVAEFKAYADVLQEDFNRCLDLIGRAEDKAKYGSALEKLMESMASRISH